MKSNRLFYFLLGGGALLAAPVFGCVSGDASQTNTSGASSGSGAASTTGSNASTGSPSSAASSGTVGAGGAMSTNHDFDSAADITYESDPSKATLGALTDFATTSDFYKFAGKKGDRIGIVALAKNLVGQMTNDPLDPTIIDLVVNIYDSSRTLIAQQDDPWPRQSNDPEEMLVLTADGTYFIEVTECNKVFAGQCGKDVITQYKYSLRVFDEWKPPYAETNEGPEPNDDIATGKATIAFFKDPMLPFYDLSVVDGLLQAPADVDHFSFTVPADAGVAAGGRPRVDFFLQTPGTNDGNGSTANVTAWITDANGTILSQVDQVNYDSGADFANGPADLSAVVTPGATYDFYAKGGAGAATDYYFLRVSPENFYLGETEANDVIATMATAQTLHPLGPATNAVSYAVDGDIHSAAEVDMFSIDTGGYLIGLLECDAQRQGSGLRGLSASILDETGTPIQGLTVTEQADKEPISDLMGTMLPMGTTKLYLQVSASGQDATITSTFYRCFVRLY